MTMKLIETKTLATAASSVEFTSIVQDGTDLLLLASTRSSVGGTVNDNLFMSANAVVSGYSNRFFGGSGGGVANGTNANNITTKTFVAQAAATGVAGSGWGNASIYIPNYRSSSNKSYSSEAIVGANSTAANEAAGLLIGGIIPVTAAITSLTLTLLSGSNFTIGTVFSLYKITSGSGGATIS